MKSSKLNIFMSDLKRFSVIFCLFAIYKVKSLSKNLKSEKIILNLRLD